jgi:hypothetical protein
MKWDDDDFEYFRTRLRNSFMFIGVEIIGCTIIILATIFLYK